MKLSARLLIFLIICTLSLQGVKAEDANDLNTGQDSDVAIELTKFDVNDTKLELAWKIKNNTNHDIWLCDGWVSRSNPDKSKLEIYMAKDNQTLVLMKRYNLIPSAILERPIYCRHVRVHAGEEFTDSISITLPVSPFLYFYREVGNAEFAKRLSFEISFYDEDLLSLILHIIEVAEKIGYVTGSLGVNDTEILVRFFGGFEIASAIKNDSFCSQSITDGGDEIIIPYMQRALTGEKVLSIDVNSVSIPFNSNWPPLENQDVNESTDSQDVEESVVSMELTHFEITDANLELGWNIKNNTDHDVWVCDTINAYNPSYKQFEVYMPEDEQTLLIRRRLDVPTVLVWAVHPQGRYVLLRSGQEQNESLSLDVPVKHQHGFSSGRTMSDHARRLVLEIGFYNEDLPGMIRDIIEIEEKLNCVQLQPVEYENPLFIYFFKGIWIAHKFYAGLSNFEEHVYQEGNEEITIPYTWQNLGSEQVLRIEVDGVSIPYED